MITITSRCLGILEILSEENAPITVKRISAKINVSERTIRYDINLLKSWLNENGIALSSIPKKGIFLNDKPAARLLLQEYSRAVINQDLHLTVKERVKIISELLILNASGIKKRDIVEQLFVCRATINKDLKAAESWLRENDILLSRDKKRGLYLCASEMRLRSAVASYLSENTDKYNFFNRIIPAPPPDRRTMLIEDSLLLKKITQIADPNMVIDVLNEISENLEIALSADAFLWVFYYILFSIFRIFSGCRCTVEGWQFQRVRKYAGYDSIQKSLYPVLNQFLSDTDAIEEEICLIALYIVSTSKVKNGIYLEQENKIANDILDIFIEIVQKRMHVTLSAGSELMDALQSHLKFAVIRSKFNVPQNNLLLDDIKHNFKEIYSLCTEAAGEIQRRFQITFDESEIGFLAIYIEAAVKQACAQQLQFFTRVALVCGQGTATVKLIQTMLEKEFPRIRVVGKLSVSDINHYDFSNVDLVLTTVRIPVPFVKPILQVNPILTKTDINRIASFFNKEKNSVSNNLEHRIEDLIRIIGNTCSIQNKEKLIKDIRGLIEVTAQSAQKAPCFPSLLEILPQKNFCANMEAQDWDEAVVKSAGILLANRAITQGYVDDMIAVKNEYNNYSILAPGICMPHAAPRPENKLSMSMITLKHPICIQLKQSAVSISVVMTLSLVDSEKHARALDELLNLIETHPNFVRDLASADSTSDLVRIFYQYYGNME